MPAATVDHRRRTSVTHSVCASSVVEEAQTSLCASCCIQTSAPAVRRCASFTRMKPAQVKGEKSDNRLVIPQPGDTSLTYWVAIRSLKTLGGPEVCGSGPL